MSRSRVCLWGCMLATPRLLRNAFMCRCCAAATGASFDGSGWASWCWQVWSRACGFLQVTPPCRTQDLPPLPNWFRSSHALRRACSGVIAVEGSGVAVSSCNVGDGGGALSSSWLTALCLISVSGWVTVTFVHETNEAESKTPTPAPQAALTIHQQQHYKLSLVGAGNFAIKHTITFVGDSSCGCDSAC